MTLGPIDGGVASPAPPALTGNIELGSGSSCTLDRYGHLLPGEARSVADRLDEMAQRATPTPTATVTPITQPDPRESAADLG